MKMFLIATALALASLTTAASADPGTDLFSKLQTATLADVQAAQAEYTANPLVPTAPAAQKCFAWAVTVIESPGGSSNFSLVVPAGFVSTIADIDVTLNSGVTVPPIVLAFNDNCGGYVEDLKFLAAAHGASTFLGLKLPF